MRIADDSGSLRAGQWARDIAQGWARWWEAGHEHIELDVITQAEFVQEDEHKRLKMNQNRLHWRRLLSLSCLMP